VNQQLSIEGLSQFWLQVKEKSRKFYESSYMLVTWVFFSIKKALYTIHKPFFFVARMRNFTQKRPFVEKHVIYN
jgi:hypothetical protein